MSEQIKNHEVEKTYIALVKGFVKEEEAEGYILFSNNYGFFYNLECIKLIASAKTKTETPGNRTCHLE